MQQRYAVDGANGVWSRIATTQMRSGRPRPTYDAGRRAADLIRDARLADLWALAPVLEGTDMFVGDELSFLLADLEAHLVAVDGGKTPPERLIVATDGDSDDAAVCGAAFFAPEAMAQGVMNLLFLGVLPAGRGRGIGRALLGRFEEEARRFGARLTIIETGSAPVFGPARALYASAGYKQEARVVDFYNVGVDKLINTKHM